MPAAAAMHDPVTDDGDVTLPGDEGGQVASAVVPAIEFERGRDLVAAIEHAELEAARADVDDEDT
jgi:hypothetical protein